MSGASVLTPIPDDARAHFAWLDAPFLRSVTDALETAAAGGARFVGGCVRDSLLGVAPKDFDIATVLPPDACMTALKSAGIRFVPTGVEHGTVTAIVDQQAVEVTTLRADVSTDGRRASVAFTPDWAVDAGRRDFTVNAIYLTPKGKIFDPLGGVADIGEKRVRFIGEPQARIREDYLRILRFFRFTARFCGAFDPAGLAACALLKDGIAQLSAERIGAELSAILAAPRAPFALREMAGAGVLGAIWSAPPDVDAAARMKALDPGAGAPLMLAALYGAHSDGLGQRLRLSNAEQAECENAVNNEGKVRGGASEREQRAQIYRLGKDGYSDALLLAGARGAVSEATYQALRELVEVWSAPVFAVSGRLVVKAGVAPGPAVSTILEAAEAQWIAEDFPDERRQQAILQARLDQFLKKSAHAEKNT